MADTETTEAPPADDERVNLKLDERGGCVLEKFGASTYFNPAQWANLQKAIAESKSDKDDDKVERDEDKAASARKTAAR